MKLFATSGRVLAVAIVLAAGGAINSAAAVITNPKPIVPAAASTTGPLTAAPAPAQVGQTISIVYTNPAAWKIDRLTLDFGDGQSVPVFSGEVKTHTYQAPGTYVLRVTWGSVKLASLSLVVLATPWYLTAKPQQGVFGEPITFALFAPPNAHQSFSICFGDESVSDAGPGVGMSCPTTIQANGTITHTYTQFGRFLIRLRDPNRDQIVVTVLPPGGHQRGGWALEAMQPTIPVGQLETFVLYASRTTPESCPIWFGDSQSSSQIRPNGVATHRYSLFGKFEVRVGSPCQPVSVLVTVLHP